MRSIRTYVGMFWEAIAWAFLPSFKTGTALGSGVWLILGVYLTREVAKERGWFEVTISNPAFEPAIIALGAFAFLFAVRLSAAPYALWKKEREHAAELREKIYGSKRLEPLAEKLRVAQEMQHRRVSSDEDLKQFASDYTAFLTETVGLIEMHFSAAEAQAFAVRPTIYAAMIPGTFNEAHTNLILFLAQYVDRLSEIIKRYAPR